MERLFGNHRGLRNLDLWIHGWRSNLVAILAHGEDRDILPAVVERNVLPRLKEAQLSDSLGRHSAGSEIGYATGVEFHANVRDIHFAGEDGQADGTNLLHRRVHKCTHYVEIMNHEIEDHVDVQRSWREDAETVDFKKHGRGDQRQSGANGRIEALQ